MRALLAIAVLLVVSACSGDTFTRDEAAKLISESEQSAALGGRIATYSGYIEDGKAQGLWTTENSREPVSDADVAEQIVELSSSYVQPATTAKIEIDVTGMLDGGDQATFTSAQFDWRYVDLPRYVKRFALAGGTGQASFQKFDDGWRLSSVSFSLGADRIQLTDAELAEIKAETDKETARRDALHERVRASVRPGKLIKSYDVDYYGAKHRYVIHENCVVYYTDIIENGRYTGKLRQVSYTWFGEVFNLREGNWGVDYNQSPDNLMNPQQFATTYYKMDTKDFLPTVIAAHAEWTKKYGDLPLPLRREVYGQMRNEAQQSSKL